MKKVIKKKAVKKAVKKSVPQCPKDLHPFQIAALILSGDIANEISLNPDLKNFISEVSSMAGCVSKEQIALVISVWRRIRPHENAIGNV